MPTMPGGSSDSPTAELQEKKRRSHKEGRFGAKDSSAKMPPSISPFQKLLSKVELGEVLSLWGIMFYCDLSDIDTLKQAFFLRRENAHDSRFDSF